MFGESILIQSINDFWDLYDSAQRGSFSVDVDLLCDLNFSGQARKMEHPLGQSADTVNIFSYSGTFNGNGHTISGINMTLEYTDGSDAGFFYALDNAIIRDLHFDSSCVFDGAWAGALAVKTWCADGAHVINVSSAATVRSGSAAGGLIGALVCTSSSSDVTFELCTNTGSVSVVTQKSRNQIGAGGIVGVSTIFGSTQTHTLSFKNCHNTGRISMSITGEVKVTDATAGGIIGGVDVSSSSSFIFESCTNKGTIRTVVESDANFLQTTPPILASGVGSFVGSVLVGTINMSNCHNVGTVLLDSRLGKLLMVHASGLSSVIADSNSGGQVTFTECHNSGVVSASSMLGNANDVLAAGISTLNTTETSQVQSCRNSGDVTSTGTVCGIVYCAQNVFNTGNTGSLEGETVYGIARKAIKTNHIVSIGDISGTKLYSSFMISSVARHIYSKNIVNASPQGTMACKNESTGRWVTCVYGNSIADVLNAAVEQNGYSMWWTSNLTLGHRVVIHGNNLPSSVINNGVVIAEHGETLRSAITRDGPAEILDESKYAILCVPCGCLDDGVESDVTITVKMKFRLLFSGLTTATIVVLDGDVPTSDMLKPINQFINNKAYIIALATNNTVFFNASAPVTSDASYIIKKTATVEVVIGDVSGLPDDDIIEAITDGISENDPSTIVRVIEIIREDDGSVVVRVIVEEDKADAAVIAISDSNNTILKRVRRAYIVTELSTSSSFSLLSLLPFFLSLLSFL